MFKKIIENSLCYDIVEEEIIEDIEEIEDIDIEDIEDIEEIEDIKDIKDIEFVVNDEGKTYYIYNFVEGKGITVLKELEIERFQVLASLVDSIGRRNIIGNLYSCLDEDPTVIGFKDEWQRFYPEIINYNYWPSIRVKDVPKKIRKEFLKNPNINSLEFIVISCILKINQEKILTKLQDDEFIEVFLKASNKDIPDYILKEFNKERLEEAIWIEGKNITLPFGIDPFLPEDIRNLQYCSLLSEEKIPYNENFTFGEYKILSPKSTMDFYEESKIMENCVGSPLQEHVEDVLDGLLQIYFLRNGDRHVATIGVRNNQIFECLGRFNTNCEQKKNGKIWFTQEESKIVDFWGKLKGFDCNY